jgi:signal transduction histidine kinase
MLNRKGDDCVFRQSDGGGIFTYEILKSQKFSKRHTNRVTTFTPIGRFADKWLHISVANAQTSLPYYPKSTPANGAGIPKSILDKIFQPFFTTKHGVREQDWVYR